MRLRSPVLILMLTGMLCMPVIDLWMSSSDDSSKTSQLPNESNEPKEKKETTEVDSFDDVWLATTIPASIGSNGLVCNCVDCGLSTVDVVLFDLIGPRAPPVVYC